jgi:hypothetical protein
MSNYYTNAKLKVTANTWRPVAEQQRSHFVTRFAFVRLVLGCVRLLLKLGVCCKSLIRKLIPNERRLPNPPPVATGLLLRGTYRRWIAPGDISSQARCRRRIRIHAGVGV